MNNDQLGEFHIPDNIREKLNDKEYLKQEFAKGRSAQDLLEFSDATMEKFFLAAKKLFQHQKYLDAANAYLFLVTLNPHKVEYWVGLGMASQMAGHVEEAIDAYELAAHYQIDNPIPYFYLAKCFFSLKESESGMDALNLAIEYSADLPEFSELHLLALAAMKEIEEAKK